jgi:hypothetical protein
MTIYKGKTFAAPTAKVIGRNKCSIINTIQSVYVYVDNVVV